MQLFHFSEDPTIEIFAPRAVAVPSKRPPGREWLNGPLVWAIDDWHQPMYFFPRDCPRILIWPTGKTIAADRERYWTASSSRTIAFIERGWLTRVRSAMICRYELPLGSFESLQDAGMWVSRAAVHPLRREMISDLPLGLALQNVELRPVDDLVQFKDLWKTSLHVSGIRLRNASGWSEGAKGQAAAEDIQ
jgi:hypothetical protein